MYPWENLTVTLTYSERSCSLWFSFIKQSMWLLSISRQAWNLHPHLPRYGLKIVRYTDEKRFTREIVEFRGQSWSSSLDYASRNHAPPVAIHADYACNLCVQSTLLWLCQVYVNNALPSILPRQSEELVGSRDHANNRMGNDRDMIFVIFAMVSHELMVRTKNFEICPVWPNDDLASHKVLAHVMCLRVKAGNPGKSTGNIAFVLFWPCLQARWDCRLTHCCEDFYAYDTRASQVPWIGF